MPDAAGALQSRNVQITKQCHRNRAWDRRGRHHQVVRVVSGLFQHRALSDTKLVLFVNHDQPQILKRNFRRDHRLGPNDDVDFSTGNFFSRFGSRFSFNASGPQRQPYARVGQQLLQRTVMLIRQDRRRRHDGGLMTVSNRQQHRANGNDRFAATNFSVEQTVHGVRLAHIGCDLLERGRLRLGQLKRQPPKHPSANLGRHLQRRRLIFSTNTIAPNRERQLQNEQLLIHQSLARRINFVMALGRMNLTDGFRNSADFQSLSKIFRKRLGDDIRALFDNASNDTANLFLRNAVG